MKALFISCALLLSAFSAFAQGYQFTEVVTVPATPVRLLPVLAGVSPLPHSWSQSYYVWVKANTTCPKCSLSARNI